MPRFSKGTTSLSQTQPADPAFGGRARRFLLRGEPWILFDAIGGGSTDPALAAAMVDGYGVRWPVTPENNPLLMSADPADRFSAILLLMFFCLAVFGLMRRSAVERTSLYRRNVRGDKIFLAELSLIGRFHLVEQFLFYRRRHRQRFSATLSAGYQTMWFSGRGTTHVFTATGDLGRVLAPCTIEGAYVETAISVHLRRLAVAASLEEGR